MKKGLLSFMLGMIFTFSGLMADSETGGTAQTESNRARDGLNGSMEYFHDGQHGEDGQDGENGQDGGNGGHGGFSFFGRGGNGGNGGDAH